MKKNKINYRVVFAAVGLSIILWGWVTLTRNYSFTIGMPLIVTDIPENQVLKSKLPDSVLVKMEGNGRSFIQLYAYNPVFRLNLSGIKKSQQIELRRRIDEVDIPSRLPIKILEIIHPKYVQIDFSRKSSKQLPVSANLSFSLEPGYVWVNTIITPDSINADGPRSVISGLTNLQTNKIEFVKPLFRPIEQEIAIDLPDESNILLNPSKVKIFVDIQRLAENQLTNIPVKIINMSGNKSASSIPGSVTIKLKGGDKILANIKKENIVAFIDYESDYDRRQKLYRINFDISENVDIISYEPQFFEILIRENE